MKFKSNFGKEIKIDKSGKKKPVRLGKVRKSMILPNMRRARQNSIPISEIINHGVGRGKKKSLINEIDRISKLERSIEKNMSTIAKENIKIEDNKKRYPSIEMKIESQLKKSKEFHLLGSSQILRQSKRRISLNPKLKKELLREKNIDKNSGSNNDSSNENNNRNISYISENRRRRNKKTKSLIKGPDFKELKNILKGKSISNKQTVFDQVHSLYKNHGSHSNFQKVFSPQLKKSKFTLPNLNNGKKSDFIKKKNTIGSEMDSLLLEKE